MIADELERRVRTLEEELIGDRHVSQYAAEQARRGTEAFLVLRSEVTALRSDMADRLATLTARVDALAESMAVVSATLVRHGRALDVLMQDTRELRGETTALRRDIAAINVRLDGMETRLDRFEARMDRMEEESAARHAELLAAIRALGGSSPPA
jgi:chromosome segregation ATPase